MSSRPANDFNNGVERGHNGRGADRLVTTEGPTTGHAARPGGVVFRNAVKTIHRSHPLHRACHTNNWNGLAQLPETRLLCETTFKVGKHTSRRNMAVYGAPIIRATAHQLVHLSGDLSKHIHGPLLILGFQRPMGSLAVAAEQPKVLRQSQVHPDGHGRAVCHHQKTWVVPGWCPGGALIGRSGCPRFGYRSI